MNIVFLLITHWCCAMASWTAQHTTVCRDILNEKYLANPVISLKID